MSIFKRLFGSRPSSAPDPSIVPSRMGRNDPCWCGSGEKYKNCHLGADRDARAEERARSCSAFT